MSITTNVTTEEEGSAARLPLARPQEMFLTLDDVMGDDGEEDGEEDDERSQRYDSASILPTSTSRASKHNQRMEYM